MRVYLANKMAGIPYFNAPWFDAATLALMSLPGIEEVFNPAEHDRQQGFDPMSCPNGTFEEAAVHGFELKNALVADWTWIGTKADVVVLGPDWANSPGAISEAACCQALRKPAYEFAPFMKYYQRSTLFAFKLPPIMELGGYAQTRSAGRAPGNPWRPWESTQWRFDTGRSGEQ